MRQYEFTARAPGGQRHSILCTAPNAVYARLQIVVKYGPDWAVDELPAADHHPHQFLGEIDAHDMTAADAAHLDRLWLAASAAARPGPLPAGLTD